MSPVLLTYPTWREMFGVRPTEQELITELSSLDRLHTFWLLARINILLALDRFHRNPQSTIELQTYLVNLFIDEALFQELKRKFGTERIVDRQPFHSLQILFLMKKVILHGARQGGIRPDSVVEGAHRLGRCLMMASDFLFSDRSARAISSARESQTRRKIALQLQVGPGLEVNNPPSIQKSIVRSDLIFEKIQKSVPHVVDTSDILRARTGLTLEEYVDLVFGVLIHYVLLEPKKLIEETGLACVDVNKYFADAPKDSVESFWRMELTHIDELEAMLRQPTRLEEQHDFMAFRKKPFVLVADGNAVPVHIGFVQEKLESGLFWTVFNSLGSDDERDALFREWGHLFERYVTQVFLETFDKTREKYFPFPKFADNDEEAFDGVLADGDYWVVMEYKGGFLKAEAKYAENEDEFLRDTERKFGAGKKAGMEQLARKVGAVFAEKTSERRSLKGLNQTGVKVVVPILVVQESFISSEITSTHLAEVFGSLKRKQRLDPKITCTIPLVLDISEIESLKPYLLNGSIRFIECVMERVRMGGSLFLSFGDFVRDYIARNGVEAARDSVTMDRFRSIMNRTSVRFFNRPFKAEDDLVDAENG